MKQMVFLYLDFLALPYNVVCIIAPGRVFVKKWSLCFSSVFAASGQHFLYQLAEDLNSLLQLFIRGGGEVDTEALAGLVFVR